MHSSISDDLSREHLALEAAKCLKNISINTKNVSVLQKELLELNLSIKTYIEESKIRMKDIRLELAKQAKSSNRVVEILTEKFLIFSELNMSQLPITPRKQNKCKKLIVSPVKEDNNNINSKYSKRQNARTFIAWYKQMVDEDRQNLALYLSDDATLEWFGRTIKSRKKVTAFLRYDMQSSRHDFTTVEAIDCIPPRDDRIPRKNDTTPSTHQSLSPLNPSEINNIEKESRGKKRPLKTNCHSPEWAENCGPEREYKATERKRLKGGHMQLLINDNKTDLKLCNGEKNAQILHSDEKLDICNKGDCALGKRAVKRKCCTVTPPNVEVGQGDCLPSTSGTDSDRSHDALNAQLPKLAVECNGYIEFMRTRNNRSVDSVKWERKCKVQISYSEDPLNVGEYILWSIRYHDESKCRRNLLAAFEEVAKEEELKKL